MKSFRSHFIVALLAAAIAIQFAPVERSNPRVTREVAWDSPRTEQLARLACYDCHSNETTWPWYAYVAPVSWRVSGHVVDGRRHLNFSNWAQPNENFDEVKEQMEEGEMPLSDYLLIHREAKLSAEETQELLAGLQRTFEQDPPIARRPPSPAEPAAVDSTAGMTTPSDSTVTSDSTAASATGGESAEEQASDDNERRP